MFPALGELAEQKSFQDQSLLTGFSSGLNTPLAGWVYLPRLPHPGKGPPVLAVFPVTTLRRIVQNVCHEFEDLPECFLL